jgi:hypothetical protein
VSLAREPFCDLKVSGSVVYVHCEGEDDTTGMTASVVMAFLADGSSAPGWPVRFAGSASIIGFAPDGSVLIRTLDGQDSSLTALGRDGGALSGWPRVVRPGIESAEVDRQGRVRITTHEWTEGQCGPAARTVYSVLGPDGNEPSGWPVSLSGWASEPALADDGTVYVVQQGGLAFAYSPSGDVLSGWPIRDIGVTVSCYDGSRPWSAGDDGVVVIGDGRATLIGRNGEVAPGWPERLPYAMATACRSCTPGPAGPADPAVGEEGIYVAAYDGDLPRIIGIDRKGSLPGAWQRGIGRAGDEILWVRVAPTGRVWAAVAAEQGTNEARAAIYPIADDRPLND